MSETGTTEDRAIAARVPAEHLAVLTRLALANDRTLSAEIRRAIREYVEAHVEKAS